MPRVAQAGPARPLPHTTPSVPGALGRPPSVRPRDRPWHPRRSLERRRSPPAVWGAEIRLSTTRSRSAQCPVRACWTSKATRARARHTALIVQPGRAGSCRRRAGSAGVRGCAAAARPRGSPRPDHGAACRPPGQGPHGIQPADHLHLPGRERSGGGGRRPRAARPTGAGFPSASITVGICSSCWTETGAASNRRRFRDARGPMFAEPMGVILDRR
jgi:hypothetical protein